MASNSKIVDYQYTINTGSVYIFRGYIYNGVLSKITVHHTNMMPLTKQEAASYILSQLETQDIYRGLMYDD